MASVLGCSPISISLWENGKFDPHPEIKHCVTVLAGMANGETDQAIEAAVKRFKISLEEYAEQAQARIATLPPVRRRIPERVGKPLYKALGLPGDPPPLDPPPHAKPKAKAKAKPKAKAKKAKAKPKKVAKKKAPTKAKPNAKKRPRK